MPIPSPRKGESEDDFVSRCVGDTSVKEDFPDQKQRLAVCFDSFRDSSKHDKDEKKRKKKVKSNMITFKAEVGKSRKEKFNDIEHLVIPVVALVEGVLHSANSEQPELALASEFGKAPAGWNGRPVTINHPEIRGEKVSANSPEVLETEQIGQLFNTKLSDKKLKTEAWINVERANAFGGEIEATVGRLLDGDVVEVSTGLFSDIESEEGTHEGEQFFGVWRNVIPDHLAILTEGNIGACSLADGCGANRANSHFKGNDKMDPLTKNSDEKVASNSQNPDDGGNMQETLSLFEKIKSFVGIRANKELSHTTILRAIESAMSEEDGFSFVVDVFKDSFIVQTEGGLFRRNFKITSSGKVKLSEERVAVRPEIDFVELKTNEETVMDKEKFVSELIANEASQFEEEDKEWLSGLDEKQLEKLAPVADAGSGDGGSKGEKTTFSANLGGKVQELDVAALHEEIKKNGPLVFGEVKTKPIDGDVKANTSKTPQTVEDYIAAAPTGMQEVLNSGIRAHNSRRTELTAQVKANSKNKFDDDTLASMSTEVLENLAALAVTDDYSTRGGPRYNEEDPNAIPAPEPVFDLSAARKAS